MSYRDFTLDQLKENFQLTIVEQMDLFEKVPPYEVPANLLELLEENIPLALAIDTEKARSEFILAPILAQYRKLFKEHLSLFSGIELSVDPEVGLNGVCDFIISYSKEQFYLDAPLLILIEAKNDRIKQGIPQCIAAMIAAQKFNAEKQNPLKIIYGIVSTGSLWRFVKLIDNTVFIDLEEYHIKELKKIFGILVSVKNNLSNSE